MNRLIICLGLFTILGATQNLFLQDEELGRNLQAASLSSAAAAAVGPKFKPKISSSESWMKSLKQNLNFGKVTINQVVLPGCHHCGFSSVVYDDGPLNNLTAGVNGSATLITQFNSLSTSAKRQAAKIISVGQRYPVLATLQMGVRYVDLRIALGSDNVTYLSHTYLSTTTLSSVLDDIDTFITANPDEILVVRITNDNNPPRYTVGGTVPKATIDSLIAASISNASQILNSTYLTQKISTYGGIFFVGEMTGSVGNFSSSIAFADNADVESLFNNITSYYGKALYTAQVKSSAFVQLGAYVRGNASTVLTTISQFMTDYQSGGNPRYDSVVSSKIEPNNLLNISPYLNNLVVTYVSQNTNVLKNTNIITIDSIDPYITQQIFKLNQAKFLVKDY